MSFFYSCENKREQENNKKLESEITKNLEAKTGDKFRFLSGIMKDSSQFSDAPYYAYITSDKLEEYGFYEGIVAPLNSLEYNENSLAVIYNSYLDTLRQIEIDGILYKKAKEIFGEKVNLYNDWTMTEEKYKYIKERLGKKDLSYEEKNGAYATVVNYFVDDLDKLDGEEIKKKTFELAKYIYDDMNYVTALQVYVRDNKYFEDYALVTESITPPLEKRKEITEILVKIKNKEAINEEEKVRLVRVFNKSLDYEKARYVKSFIHLNEIKTSEELILNKVDITIIIDYSGGKYD